MLWHKGWLETRYRLLFALGFVGLFQILQYKNGTTPQGISGLVQFTVPVLVVMTYSLLAGAGIATQPSLVASKGIHGSTLFTLSLPVSRLRLMSVRAAIGWLEGIGVIGVLCCAVWFSSPALRAMVGPGTMLQYAATLIGCGSAIYFVSVLLGTFLDDQWRTWGTMLTSAALWWLSTHTALPAFLDIFRGMGKGSPLFTHTMPWNGILFSMLLAALLFFVALKVLRAREY
jgi:hypothetical protein